MTTTPPTAVRDRDLHTHPQREDGEIDRLLGNGGYRMIPATVTANELIAPNLRRITLASPVLRGLTLTGPDEYVGLLMPVPGVPLPDPASVDVEGLNIRAAVADLPEQERPGLRWYTIRHFRQDAGEIDLDVVMHDDHSGPGSLWCTAAGPGDAAGIWLCNAIWIRHADRPLFVADPSAVPALRAILEFTADHHPDDLAKYHVYVVAHSPDDLEAGLAEEWEEKIGSLKIIYAAPGMEKEAVTTQLRRAAASDDPAAAPEYVWVSGEAGLAKEVRGVAVDELGVDRDFVDWVAYWIEGRPRP
ncbi:siderophore-interacting protein [Corynebacterium nuruki]|uniref:siderophore-interacting protein n=1 Tax=Corynebacterium nuruki TaxID=1032851 RepID=UPI0039BF11BB